MGIDFSRIQFWFSALDYTDLNLNFMKFIHLILALIILGSSCFNVIL
jgi:hypothetical protein